MIEDMLIIGPGLVLVRRRRWWLWSVILVYLPAMWVALRVNPTYSAIGTIFVIWLVLLIIAVIRAALARCPRCGNYFHMHGPTFLLLRHCLHCQLFLKADRAG